MPDTALASAERRQRILGIVREQGQVQVTHLSDVFGVSEVTIRADLTSLARRGRRDGGRRGRRTARRPRGRRACVGYPYGTNLVIRSKSDPE